ncbi:integrase arm-type DNA-binding domain-containing protein [Campylobacter geochelonis]|uniref:Putative prophage integrase n=1 Tax=Campylobacter geochelonis TaxID=1780362 RepID=A0A128EGM6_9BACT|nr:integrase arm-type DNA-binding domain-containing protein [Campylobacter geochelonis]QKF70837.1 Arm DNA-binding domain-containing protein [Campylobacter geochelonis]CZE48040.1 putative prophage integrase [Campylobacter geochelonis]
MLSDTQIKNLKPQNKDYFISDIDNLSLVIKTNGNKIWRFRYTSPATLKRRLMVLGNYPALSLANARNKATKFINDIRQGFDPLELLNEFKSQIKPSFESVINEWLETKSYTTEKTQKNIKSLMINDVLPSLKDKTIDEIKHPDLVKILILKQSTAPIMASKLLRYLNDLWQYSCTKGYCETKQIFHYKVKQALKALKTYF